MMLAKTCGQKKDSSALKFIIHSLIHSLDSPQTFGKYSHLKDTDMDEMFIIFKNSQPLKGIFT